MRSFLAKNSRQMVIKAGTRLLTDTQRIGDLVAGIAKARAGGRKVLLVTSGAVGMGMRELGFDKRPQDLALIQALAAVGQCKLMNIYEAKCREHGFACAQLLLTKADLQCRERYMNVMNCINSLWDNEVLPIVNENDSISVDELKFGDNDTLAGMLATLTGSSLTVLLTTENGLRTRNEDGTLGDRISVVSRLTDDIVAHAGGTDNAEFSIGGMASKLKAAEMVTRAGEYLWIADGREKNIIERILDGDDVGTLFLPGKNRISSRKRWLKFFAACKGRLLLDEGAVKAVEDSGKSLLPAGLIGVEGDFKRGDCVEIADREGRIFGCGLVNFDADECRKLVGVRSEAIERILGHPANSELVHRDNLVIKSS